MTAAAIDAKQIAVSWIAVTLTLASAKSALAQMLAPAYVPGSHSAGTVTLSPAQQAAALKLRRTWIAAGHPVSDATQYPKITAVKLLTPILTIGQAPAAPALQLSYTTGPAGLHELSGRYLAPNNSQQLYLDYVVPAGTPPSTSGTIILQQPVSNSPITADPSTNAHVPNYGALSAYAEPGPWILVNLFITDNAGNSGVSGKPGTLTVVNNGTPDVTAPTVIAASVLTPTVSRSNANPAFVTTLTVADDLSGVHDAFVSVKPPGFIDSTIPNVLPSPLASGTITNALLLPPDAPLGIWHIVGYEVCDVAGNCTAGGSPKQIMALFGTTTFTVTR